MISFANPDEDGASPPPPPPPSCSFDDVASFTPTPAPEQTSFARSRKRSRSSRRARMIPSTPTPASNSFTTGRTSPSVPKRSTRPSYAATPSRSRRASDGASPRLRPCHPPPHRAHRTLSLGPFAGLIYTTILIVDCLFFLLLEWWMPRHDMDFVQDHWKQDVFTEFARAT